MKAELEYDYQNSELSIYLHLAKDTKVRLFWTSISYYALIESIQYSQHIKLNFVHKTEIEMKENGFRPKTYTSRKTSK